MKPTNATRYVLPGGRLTVELHPDGDAASDAIADWTFEVEHPGLAHRVTVEQVDTSDSPVGFAVALELSDLPGDVLTQQRAPRDTSLLAGHGDRIEAALGQLLDYLWSDEQEDFLAQEMPKEHVFRALQVIRSWLAAQSAVAE